MVWMDDTSRRDEGEGGKRTEDQLKRIRGDGWGTRLAF